MNRRLRVLATLLSIAMACVAPASVHAQGPGVTFDDDSPAGKEYALPLDQSRQIGGGAPTTRSDGGRAGVASAAKLNTLFGVGVQHSPSTAASGGKGTRSSGEGARSSGEGPRSKSSPARPDGNSPSSPGSDTTGSTSGSGASQVEHALATSGGRQRAVGLLIGAAALLLAGLATLVLRLRGRRSA